MKRMTLLFVLAILCLCLSTANANTFNALPSLSSLSVSIDDGIIVVIMPEAGGQTITATGAEAAPATLIVRKKDGTVVFETTLTNATQPYFLDTTGYETGIYTATISQEGETGSKDFTI